MTNSTNAQIQVVAANGTVKYTAPFNEGVRKARQKRDQLDLKHGSAGHTIKIYDTKEKQYILMSDVVA